MNRPGVPVGFRPWIRGARFRAVERPIVSAVRLRRPGVKQRPRSHRGLCFALRAAGFAGDGSDPLKAQLNYPSGIAIDAMGSIYAADVAPHNVRKYVKR